MIDEDHQGTLNPDDGSIAQVFDRNEDYYICIRPDYAEDQVVVDFYQKLLLGSEFRRLDYLLLEIKNFISTQRTSNPTVAEKLEHFLEFRRISFVGFSSCHNKSPHLLDSISYCLTDGVQFNRY